MPVATVTNEVMKHIPAALRPNPYNIDDEVMHLTANGWATQDIVKAALADNPKQPGHMVAAIRKLVATPAPVSADDYSNLVTGPCQQGCTFGWFDHLDGTEPCPTCRPDTYRRYTAREQARKRGASLDELNRIMVSTAAKDPVPHTYWTNDA